MEVKLGVYFHFDPSQIKVDAISKIFFRLEVG